MFGSCLVGILICRIGSLEFGNLFEIPADRIWLLLISWISLYSFPLCDMIVSFIMLIYS